VGLSHLAKIVSAGIVSVSLACTYTPRYLLPYDFGDVNGGAIVQGDADTVGDSQGGDLIHSDTDDTDAGDTNAGDAGPPGDVDNTAPYISDYRVIRANVGADLLILFSKVDAEGDPITATILDYTTNLLDTLLINQDQIEGSNLSPSTIGPAYIDVETCDDKDACAVNTVEFENSKYHSNIALLLTDNSTFEGIMPTSKLVPMLESCTFTSTFTTLDTLTLPSGFAQEYQQSRSDDAAAIQCIRQYLMNLDDEVQELYLDLGVMGKVTQDELETITVTFTSDYDF